MEKERKRWHTRRQQKKVKVVDDLSERQKRVVRKNWRNMKREYRMKQRNIANITPPSSGRSSQIKKRGRPKVPYSRKKAYRNISKKYQQTQSGTCISRKPETEVQNALASSTETSTQSD